MKKRIGILLLALAMAAGMSAQPSGTYRNPVIPGYHPDPSVCRVGDDFYLVNSSFEYFPGVPIFHSRDLVNWKQIGNVLDRESQLPLKGATSWLGIYAPTIRYHEGTYYMITTNIGNGGNFMVTATNPAGPWSEPIWLQQQGIDPSLYFENGKCYMVSNPDNTIMLCEIDPKTGRQLTESRPLWQGTGGRYPEGPHIYKKDGWYYLLISEGGTELAHKLTIARSKEIEGPYTPNPNNPILTNCSMKGQDKQIQGTGHGDLVQAKDGSWWMVFLAYRNFGGAYHHLGRETFLAPVEWNKGQWPVVNGGEPIDTLMTVASKQTKAKKNKDISAQNNRSDMKEVERKRTKSFVSFVPSDSRTFELGPEWVFIQNPDSTRYDRHVVVDEATGRVAGGSLRLYGGKDLNTNARPTFIGRRQESAHMTVETLVNSSQAEAGLTVYQINDGHLDLCVNNGYVGVKCKLKNIYYIVREEPVRSAAVKLRISSDGEQYVFEYSDGGAPFRKLCELNCSLVSTEVAGGFTGVVIGMFAQGPGFADFGYFKYEE